MEHRIKSLMNDILDKFGLEIKYVGSGEGDPNMFINSLEGAISVKKPLNIVEVGANDGKVADPIYEFVNKNSDLTNIILVEPQELVIPYLKENYSEHPSSEVVNRAIATKDKESIQLYRIKKEYWEEFSNRTSGPYFREATGITSSNKQNVRKWASKRLKDPEKAIERVTVNVISPGTILENSKVMDTVDVLQVDTEGMDDEIVYSFFDSRIYPDIINIESKLLSKKQNERFNKRVSNHGYEIYDYTPGETLALKR